MNVFFAVTAVLLALVLWAVLNLGSLVGIETSIHAGIQKTIDKQVIITPTP